MAKKLALVISGAVSLGTYEAGVVYELLAALAYHNTRNPGKEILIDVITGASAGGMNTVILAQKLLFQPSRLSDVQDNDLYLPWVRDVDLTGLLNLGSEEKSILSALSSDLIETLAQNYLISSYTSGDNIQSEARHPAADSAIQIGLAMSNLNGVDYGIDLLSGGTMPYTRFQDQVIVTVDSTNPDHDSADFWEPLCDAAVACGAFPFAFRVKDVVRQNSDYQDPAPLTPLPAMPHFAYTDGGTFQNEPIALAKRLVDSIDNHLNDDRYYMFVAPGMRTSAAKDFSAAPRSDYFDYWNTGQALVNAIFNQARYRDLNNVEEINDRVAQLDAQAGGLLKLYQNGKVTPQQMDPATSSLLQNLFPAPAGAPAGTLGADGIAAQDRLRQQYATEYNSLLAINKGVAESWINAVLLLESVACLGPQDTMKIYAITDDKNRIAGSGLLAFAGFFDVAYRQHDYDLGRQSARDFIDWLNKQSTPGLGPIQQQPNLNPITIDSALDGLELGAIDQSKRQALYDRLHDRASDLMVELGINAVIREGFFLGYIDGALKKLLQL
ncbi:MAG TPA: patatin-like phospholipase family protein [Tepidisphaeraceae bacterium]|jgi:hypothetical protein